MTVTLSITNEESLKFCKQTTYINNKDSRQKPLDRTLSRLLYQTYVVTVYRIYNPVVRLLICKK